ncbi:lipid kinase YegS [Asticcacaulis sp. MM231]|uniref:diacylglycerol/lipid kinase family protein n=1 Tax=Asticcacaulis sp. MM231 TaxID=3157666 RepID=UPI0032D586F4
MTDQVFNILINGKSGTVLNMGQPAIESAITHSGIGVAELFFSAPEDMRDNLARLSKQNTPLLIGGGDGTIRETAKYMSSHGKPFGILPFGTMNLLAHDLGLTTLQQALSAYTAGAQPSVMDAGFVNGEIFLCCASIGTMPEASVYREENRQQNDLLLIPRMFLFVVQNLEKNQNKRLSLKIDGQKMHLRSPALVVSINRFAESSIWTQSNFKRANLTGGELAVYAPETLTHMSRLRFLTRLLVGNWLKDPDLNEMTGKRVTVKTKQRHDVVSIDGEVMELTEPLRFSLKQKFVKLLLPATPAQS